MAADYQTERDKAPDVGRITAFNQSEFAQLLGMEITEAYDGYARVVMDCTGKNNPRGVAHGGAIFALADQAFGIAANCGDSHLCCGLDSYPVYLPCKRFACGSCPPRCREWQVFHIPGYGIRRRTDYSRI